MNSRTSGTAYQPAKPARQKSNRRQSARQNARVRARRKRILQMVTIVALLAVVAVTIWKVTASNGTADGQALNQFDTQDFHSLAFDPENLDRIYFGHHYGLKVSDNAGKNWRDSTLKDVDVMQFAIPAADPLRRYASGHEVFYTSTDGGQSWSVQPNNLPGLDLHTFAASPSDALRLYALPLGHGFFSSTDGGETWQQATLPPGGDRAHVALTVSPTDPDHLFAGMGSNVFESLDAGVTWREHSTTDGIIVTLTAAAVEDETLLFAGTSQGLYQVHEGANWERLPVETEGAVLAIATHGQPSPRIAIVDQQGHFYRSDDGGSTWGN